jgi:hypothetical protein
MNKDCNGCFGAAGDDCQRCRGTDKQPSKLDITPELAIAAYNTMIDYCKHLGCKNCIFNQIHYTGSKEITCDCDVCPSYWQEITLPSLDGNTVTYMKDGQIKRITCSRKEEAQELFEEVKRGKKWSEVTSKEIIKLKHQQCSKCYYFSKANGGSISVGL